MINNDISMNFVASMPIQVCKMLITAVQSESRAKEVFIPHWVSFPVTTPGANITVNQAPGNRSLEQGFLPMRW